MEPQKSGDHDGGLTQDEPGRIAACGRGRAQPSSGLCPRPHVGKAERETGSDMIMNYNNNTGDIYALYYLNSAS